MVTLLGLGPTPPLASPRRVAPRALSVFVQGILQRKPSPFFYKKSGWTELEPDLSALSFSHVRQKIG
jgi:hypothetical protein